MRIAKGRVLFVDRAGRPRDLAQLPETDMQSLRGNEIAILDDNAAAAQYRHWPAAQPAAFVRGVADIVVQHCSSDGDLALGIPDRDIGVAADRDRAFLRVEAVKLGVVGCGQCDKGIEVEPALSDAF